MIGVAVCGDTFVPGVRELFIPGVNRAVLALVADRDSDGDGPDADYERAMAAGGDVVLPSPCPLQQLAGELNLLLTQSAALRRRRRRRSCVRAAIAPCATSSRTSAASANDPRAVGILRVRRRVRHLPVPPPYAQTAEGLAPPRRSG